MLKSVKDYLDAHLGNSHRKSALLLAGLVTLGSVAGCSNEKEPVKDNSRVDSEILSTDSSVADNSDLYTTDTSDNSIEISTAESSADTSSAESIDNSTESSDNSSTESIDNSTESVDSSIEIIDPSTTESSEESNLESGEESNDNDFHLPNIVLRSEEEIQRTGVQPKDIIDRYSSIICEATKGIMDIRDDYYDIDSVSLLKIWPDQIRENEESPCYPLWTNNYLFLSNVLEKNPNGGYMAKKIDLDRPVYLCGIGFVINQDMVGSFYKELNNLAVTKDTFDNFAEAFGIEKFTFTQEDVDRMQNDQNYYSRFVGQEVYRPTTIDIDMINNANQEQLNALYEMVKEVKMINLDGVLPKKSPVIENMER